MPPRVKLLRVVRKKRRRVLHSDDIAKLLRAADQRPGRPDVGRKVKAFILIAASTGMRMEEILHLQWQDVDFDDRRFDVRAKEWTQQRGLHIQRCSWSPKSTTSARCGPGAASSSTFSKTTGRHRNATPQRTGSSRATAPAGA